MSSSWRPFHCYDGWHHGFECYATSRDRGATCPQVVTNALGSIEQFKIFGPKEDLWLYHMYV